MPLFAGTDDGLYRASDYPFDEVECILDCGRVTQVTDLEFATGLYVAASAGAFRSTDGGETWESLDVPAGDRYWVKGDSDVFSVHAAPDGTLYAGTNHPAIHRSFDGGETWHELRGLKNLPTYGLWESPEDPKRARIRTIATPPDRPDRLVVGVEVGGVHYSDDGGESWVDRRDAIPEDDVHQVLPLTGDCWLAATGYFDLDLEHVGLRTGLGHATGWGGLYRTVDAGETWRRLDSDNDYAYIRKCFTHDGRLFFSGAAGAPPAWAEDDNEAALFESTNFGRTFERVSFPGEPRQVIEDWTVAPNGDLLCGSGLFDVPNPRSDVEGLIMRRTDVGDYDTVGTLPSSVGRLEAV